MHVTEILIGVRPRLSQFHSHRRKYGKLSDAVGIFYVSGHVEGQQLKPELRRGILKRCR